MLKRGPASEANNTNVAAANVATVPHSEDEDTKKPNPASLHWRILDLFICFIFLAPLVVSYWRGTWELLTFYFAPNNEEVSAWMSTVLGLFLVFIATVLQELFKKGTRGMHYLPLTVITRLYIYVVGFGVINLWRGIWFLLDYYSGRGVVSSVVSFVIGLIALGVSRAINNINAPPLIVVVDRNSCCFDIPTRFGTTTKCLWKYVLDACFTVFVVGVMVVFQWRGAWTLIDNVVFANDVNKSAIASLIAGYVICFIYAFLQFPAEVLSRYLSRKQHIFWKILTEAIYWQITLFGPLNVWRGFWLILNTHFLPEHFLLNRWISHIVGTLGLILLVNLKSVLVVGCHIDGGSEAGIGVRLPVFYIQDLMEDSRIFANFVSVTKPEHTPMELMPNGDTAPRSVKEVTDAQTTDVFIIDKDDLKEK